MSRALTQEERIAREKKRINACTNPIHGLGFYGKMGCGLCDACKAVQAEFDAEDEREGIVYPRVYV